MPDHEPIAIIGIGCRCPGGVQDTESFWELMRDGVDAITEIPEGRWNVDQFYHPDPLVLGTTYSKWGGFVEGMDQFDPGAFGISPREALSMDPQQRMILEVTLEAIEDAGMAPVSVRGSSVGVFVGISTWDYSNLQYESSAAARVDPYAATGTALSIAANRVSYCFDFHGPSMVVDTACSSSLVAVHLACDSLRRGDCKMAVAGGVNAFLSPANAIAFSKMGVLSPEGRCKAFDASANGFVRAEGAGVVLLKPLSQALRDGDKVYAVVRATGVNQDGVTNGLAVPNGRAQAALIRDTFDRGGLDLARVAYVEAHGTGTAVGDPTEAHAIGSTIGKERSAPCLMGSVKTNIGHLESAAGIAGLIKTALVLQRGMVPPNLHFNTPNPHIDFAALGLEVVTGLRPLGGNGNSNGSSPLLAAVNSFGFGGTNALVVLSPAPSLHAAPHAEDMAGPWLIPLSAASDSKLAALTDTWSDFLREAGDLRDIGRTAALRREHRTHRLCVVASSGTEAADRIKAFRADERVSGVVTGKGRGDAPPKIAFVFSGQGPQWFGMGRGIYASNAVYRQKMDECDALVRRFAGWSLIEMLSAAEEESKIRETEFAQPALCALQISLAHVWMSCGITPVATVGHSIGELAAAHIAGRISLEETMRIAVHRGDCIARFARRGGMLAASLRSERAKELLVGNGHAGLEIAAFNGPGQVTFAGERDALGVLASQLVEEGVHHQLLHVDYAFHSDLLEPAREPFLEAIGHTHSHAGDIRWISTVTHSFIDNGDVDRHYWWRNMREPVHFFQSVEQLLDEGCDCFVELSPHPVLLPSITESFRARELEPRVAISLRRDVDEPLTMLANLGQLHCWGCDIDWSALYPTRRPLAALPRYPWVREFYWLAGKDGHRAWLEGRSHPLLGTPAAWPKPAWRTRIDLHRLPFLEEHRLQNRALFPAAGYVEMALAAAREILGVERPVLEDLELRKALFLPAEPESAEMLTEYEAADRELRFFSRTGASSANWTLHCRIRLGGENHDSPTTRFDREATIARCPDCFPGEIIYDMGETTQLEYRNTFRGMKQFWRSSSEVVARIERPASLESNSGQWIFHPAFLDACFQASTLNRPFGRTSGNLRGATFVPVGVAEMRLYQRPTSRILWVHVRKTRDTPRSQQGDLWIYDDEGRPVLGFRGFESQGLEHKAIGDGVSIDDWASAVQFVPKALLPQAGCRAPLAGDHRWPALSSLAEEIRLTVEDILKDASKIKRIGSLREKLNELAVTWWESVFRALGIAKCQGMPATFESVMQVCGVAPQQQRYASYALSCLAKVGVISATDSGWAIAAERVMRADPVELWREMLAEFPTAYAELMILQILGSNMAALLTGQTTLQEQLFNRAAEGLMDHFYQDSIGLISRNAALAQVVKCLAAIPPGDRKLRVLEIGAGTGGVTSHILPMLEGREVEYIFTDVTPAFLATARRKYSDYPFVDYRLLDLEKDPLEQEFEAGGYDVIVAANVVHAVPDVARSMAHVSRLLAPGGVFCLLELVTAPSSLHFIFGLTEQWWIHQDERMQPINRGQWQCHLRGQFADVVELSDGMPASGSELVEIAVFLARGSHATADAEAAPPPSAETSAPLLTGHWLILGDQQQLGATLADALKARGARCRVLTVREGLDRIAEEMQAALDARDPFDSVVHLWALDSASNDGLSIATMERDAPLSWESALAVVKKVAQIDSSSRPRIFMVTSGIDSFGGVVGPAALLQSTVRGVLSVALCEYPALQVKLVDLDPALPAAEQLAALKRELVSGDLEQEVVFRGHARYVARLRSTTLTEVTDGERRWLPNDTAPGDPEPRFELPVPGSGTLDRLAYRMVRERSLLRHQLEVRVVAAGLNFRDVLKALGRYPLDGDYDKLGDECSGIVERVGEGVTEFKPGDEVICAGSSCFASHVITYEHLTMPKPAHLMFEEAVTLPIAFLTAHYCLREVANLQRGETVLIHAAAGGVGLAAIQIAQQCGATVIATASSRKQNFVRLLGVEHVLDSRTLDFAQQIRAITDGRGVDVILNSLAGEAIDKSLSVLARYGRFVEIGKRDLYENRNLALGCFREGISFHSVDLSRVMADRPEVVRRIREELSQAFATGRLRPLAHRIFAANRIRDAFRTMADAKHVGKIVISMRRPDIRVEPLAPEAPPLREDAMYLITGGFGGFGSEIARAMLSNGARNVVLLGRSDPSSEKVSRTLSQLAIFDNATVVPMQVDVADPVAMAEVFRRMRDELPPLRGVVHTAGVLDDGPILQLDAASFRRVFAPKVHGLWNLHELTRDLELDFFSVTSSSASLLGNAGQANYAAANAFLDTFAWFRHMQGLPANAVNFGPLAEAGMVARDAGLIDRMARLGVTMMPMRKGIEILRAAQLRRLPQIGAVRVRWRRWLDAVGFTTVPSKVLDLYEQDTATATAEQSTSELLQSLRQASATELPKLVKTYVATAIARVLGTQADKLDPTQPLQTLGLDSLATVELCNRIEGDLRITMPHAELAKKPTLTQLSAVVLNLLPKTGAGAER